MEIGKRVFEIHLEKVKSLLILAKSQENPAAFLFSNDLRTPMFMLQACGRIFSKIYDSDVLEALKEDFKQIEDLLGAIDYYLASSNNLKDLIPEAYISFFNQKAIENTQKLAKVLNENGWLSGQKIYQIEQDLDSTDWEKDRKEIKKFYTKAIEKIDEFVTELDFKFTDLEAHVHELRRKVRWLSIYPQALQGVFAYDEFTNSTPDYLQKYLTEGVMKSPFNVLPTNIQIEKPIYLEKGHYLAMSWLISELGKIKDAGLQVEIVKEAIMHTEGLNQEQAHTKAKEVLGNPDLNIHLAQTQAEEISKVFFAEEILSKILID